MARVRVTGLSAQAGAAPQARVRVTGLSVTAGAVAQARIRVTELSVTAGGAPSTVARVRVTELSVTTKGLPVVGRVRLVELAVQAGPQYQQVSALASVFYLDTDGVSYRPFRLLTLADAPW